MPHVLQSQATRNRRAPHPVQYKVAVALFILTLALAALIGMHHLFWACFFLFTPTPAEMNFGSALIFGNAFITVPVMLASAFAAKTLWFLVNEEA